MSNGITLRQLLDNAAIARLTLSQRKLVVRQALVLFEQNYVHLPVKTAMYAAAPVQRLRLLQARLNRQTADTMDPESDFHAELLEIFHSVRDLHTRYSLPAPLGAYTAYLPFRIEEYADRDSGEARWLVSRLADAYTPPAVEFQPGVEVTHWNGVPISRAIDLNAARFAGSNAAARRARGLLSLTIRPLSRHLPPDEEWVIIDYLDSAGERRTVREQWRAIAGTAPVADPAGLGEEATDLGYDQHGELIAEATKAIFVPWVVAEAAATQAATGTMRSIDGGLETTMPDIFRAREVTTSSGTFGHLRIFSFLQRPTPPDFVSRFVTEFVRLIGQLPGAGLIIDVRANSGGHIWAAELILQTLTPRRIEPEPVQLINTPLNLRLCRRDTQLKKWEPSIEEAVETGASFSAAFPLTPADLANDRGQQYFGPVVLIIDGTCYSATDIFAAGFQDHGIGPVIGTDAHTGAGGANVWDHTLFLQRLEDPDTGSAAPYEVLPTGIGMGVSLRRTLRVGATRAGTLLEDFGVKADHVHRLTRDDLLDGNKDLLDYAGTLLSQRPVQHLDVTATTPTPGTLSIAVTTTGVDRVDVYLDDRPAASTDLAGPAATIEVSVPSGGFQQLRVEGFAAGELVAARRSSASSCLVSVTGSPARCP